MSRTLVITNDFPPRVGGIQSFVHSLASQLPPDELVVYASRWEGAAAFDAAQRFPVVRHPTSLMLPTPGVLRRARAIAAEYECDSVWFGAAAPLGLLAGPLRREPGMRADRRQHPWPRGRLGEAAGRPPDAGAHRPGVRHGHLSRRLHAPAARGRLRSRDALRPPAERCRHRRVLPGCRRAATSGVATASPIDRSSSASADWWPAKGQDVLIRALPAIRRRVPDTALLIVGGGPYRKRARAAGTRDRASSATSSSADRCRLRELPAHYAAGDVFAMPCRSRLAGLEVEGLGIVYLEANACGLPVVAGDSGGAPDAVLEGKTGYVVDGRDTWRRRRPGRPSCSPTTPRARPWAQAGREWVAREWRWPTLAARLQGLLHARLSRPTVPTTRLSCRAPRPRRRTPS